MWESDIGALPVDWDTQGDEWLHHLREAVTAQDIRGMSAEGDTWRKVVLVTLTSESLRSRLRVEPHDSGIRCTVFSDHGEPSDDQVQPWAEGVTAAAAGLGTHEEDFAWQAILGLHPRWREWQRRAPLAMPVTLGAVTLAPGGIQMREWTGTGPEAIDQRVVSYSWPLIASGTVRTHDMMAAHREAKFCMHRACALLSLIWKELWIPRAGPVPLLPDDPDVPLLVVPQSVGPRTGTSWPDQSLPPDFNVYQGDEARELPDWALAAWAAVDAEPVLTTALSAHYEGLRLEVDHPSAAHVAFVAAIEGVGRTLADLEECEKCGSKFGAGRRFRKALRNAMSSKEVKQLGDSYARRSQTAHDGSLLGTEETLGTGRFSLFQDDPHEDFEMACTRQAGRASRLVVTKAIRDAAERQHGQGQMAS